MEKAPRAREAIVARALLASLVLCVAATCGKPGGEVVFAGNPDSGVDGGAACTSALVCDERLLPDRWNAPEQLPAPVNTGLGWIDQPWISPDGNRLYFIHHDCGNPANRREGWVGWFDIFVSERQSGGAWGPAVALPPPINSDINESSAVEALDGTRLFFAQQDLSEARVGRTRRLLYTAHRGLDGGWGAPVDLGAAINRPGMQADCPSLTGDGRTLCFMHNAVQDADAGVDPDTDMHVFCSTRPDVSCDTCWQPAVEVGAPVKGARELQPMLRPSGKVLYFTGYVDSSREKIALFVSHQDDDGAWQNPVPLLDLHDPAAIGEGAASLTGDGNRIYFARGTPTGVSSADPCVAVRFELWTATRRYP